MYCAKNVPVNIADFFAAILAIGTVFAAIIVAFAARRASNFAASFPIRMIVILPVVYCPLNMFL